MAQKTSKYLFIILLFIAVKVAGQSDSSAVAGLIEAQHFTFQAVTAQATGSSELNQARTRIGQTQNGSKIDLTGSLYNVHVTADSITANLPYYGRLYKAPINADETGIFFKSKKFDYKLKKRERKTWIIEISPRDTHPFRELIFYISKDGRTTLYINSNDRQAISFEGYITGY